MSVIYPGGVLGIHMRSAKTSEKMLDELIDKVVRDYPFGPDDPKESDKRYYLEYHKNRFRETLDVVPDLRAGSKLLEIGPTHFSLVVKSVYPGCSISAIDILDTWGRRLKQAGVEFKVCDLAKDPIPFESDSFDVVLFTEVLEHISASHEIVLGEIRRVMKKDAKLVFSVPNIATFTNRVRLLIGENPTKWTYREDYRHGHLHEFTRREASDLLAKCGFRVVSCRYIDNCRKRNTNIPRADRPRLSILPSFRQTILFECVRAV